MDLREDEKGLPDDGRKTTRCSERNLLSGGFHACQHRRITDPARSFCFFLAWRLGALA